MKQQSRLNKIFRRFNIDIVDPAPPQTNSTVSKKEGCGPRLRRPLNFYLDYATKIRSFIGPAAQIYTGIKLKQPILVGGGIAEAVERIYEELDFEVAPLSLASDMGYSYVDASIGPLAYQAIQETTNRDIFKVKSPEYKYDNQIAVEYSIYSHRVYLVELTTNSKTFKYVLYYNEEVLNKITEIVATWIKKKSSTFTRLHLDKEGELVSEELNIEGSRIKLIEEDKILDRTLKFLNRGISRSILLVGPSGSGKTTFAYWLSKQLPSQGLISISCGDLDELLNQGQNSKILQLIDLLDAPVVLLDDVDRISDVNKHEKDLLHLLSQRTSRPSVLVGTANDLGSISAALRRPGRFDEIIVQPCPTIEQTVEIIKLHVEEAGTRLSTNNINRLAEWAYGLTPAYLKEIAQQATIYEIEELENVIKKMKGLCIDAYTEENW